MLAIILASFGFVLAIGLLSGLRSVSRINARYGFVKDFADHFAACASGEDYDQNISWLNLRIARLSDEIGPHGLVQYRPAFANYLHNDYALVPNTIVKMSTGTAASQDKRMTAALLLQHLGRLEDLGKDARRWLENPVHWFFDGVRTVLSIPAWVLAGSGIIRASTVQRFKDSRIVRFLTVLVSLAGTFSTIMSIALGWDAFIALVGKLLGIQ